MGGQGWSGGVASSSHEVCYGAFADGEFGGDGLIGIAILIHPNGALLLILHRELIPMLAIQLHR